MYLLLNLNTLKLCLHTLTAKSLSYETPTTKIVTHKGITITQHTDYLHKKSKCSYVAFKINKNRHMKIIKLTFFFFLIFAFSLNAQNTYYWAGGETGNWNTPSSWRDSDGNILFNTPGSNDTAVFNDINPTVSLLLNPTVAKLVLSGTSEVTFKDGTIQIGILEVFSNSKIILTANTPNRGIIQINNSAEIYGEIEVDYDSGIRALNGTTQINFEDGSIFNSGANSTYQITNGGNQETVFFKNGSSYKHYGGFSPVNYTGDDVVVFEPESNYEIRTSTSSHIKISGNTFGNIKVFEDVNYTYSSNTDTTTFNNLIIENGKTFSVNLNGTNNYIKITGDTIYNGNTLSLTANNGIRFTNTTNPVVIEGTETSSTIFKVSNTNTNSAFTFVESDVEIILKSNIELQGMPKYKVFGTIDFEGSSFVGNLSLQDGSLIKTLLSAGFSGLTLEETGYEILKFYGGSLQKIGISGGVNVKKIILDKTSNSHLRLFSDCETKFLSLNSGTFDIKNQTLKITDNINYEGGILEGNTTSSRLELGGNGNDTINLQTPLGLSDLVIGTSVNLIYSELLTVEDSLELNNGNLNILTSNLKLGDNIVISSSTDGNFSNSYIIAEETGKINKVFSNDSNDAIAIPVGTSNYLSAISIVPNENAEYSINVFDHVYSDGYNTYGTAETYPYVLDMTWNIETNISNEGAILQIYWIEDGSIQADDFNAANAYISYFDKNTEKWSPEVTGSFPNPSLVSSMIGSTKTFVNNGIYCVASEPINNVPVVGGQSFDVDRFSPTGTLIGELDAIDSDEEQTLTFTIISNIFEIYIDGNSIYVGDSTQLADATDNFYIFDAEVCDNGYPNLCATFLITVDILDPIPVSSDHGFTIPEHSLNGFEVGQLATTNVADTGTVVFELLEPEDAFSLSRDGLITVANSSVLEYSTNPEFEFSFKVFYRGLSNSYNEYVIKIILTEISPNDIFVSNFISPNGDGINDTWIVSGGEEKYSVMVFNKVGNLVFKSDDYRSRWDGISRGHNLSPGVYYYIIKANNTEKKGTITLVR